MLVGPCYLVHYSYHKHSITAVVVMMGVLCECWLDILFRLSVNINVFVGGFMCMWASKIAFTSTHHMLWCLYKLVAIFT